jgi:hypothetical protein
MILAVFRRRLRAGVSFDDFIAAFYDLRSEHDFSGDPRAIDLGSAESLLGRLMQ